MTTREAAEAALARHDWQAALDVLAEASEPGPDELLMQAEALWWTGRPVDSEAAYEKAFSGFVAEDRPTDAAVVAATLAYLAVRRDAMSVAGGWAARLGELLEGQPESVGHVWHLTLQQAMALFGGDAGAAIELGDRVLELASRVGAPGLRGIAMSFKGYALISSGRWREGMKLIDEATVVAMAEGADLRAAADVYCNTIAACRDVADYRRAAEWTDQAERWMEANSIGGYPGICKVHRAELKRLRGSWSEAEDEARRACVELERYRLLDGIGFAHYEMAEVRRRMGDLEGAEQAFMRAHEHGHGCQPGLALMLLDRGEVDDAAEALDEALDAVTAKQEATGSSGYVVHSRLLPARVEVALAMDDVDTARSAVERLEEMAGVFEGAAWRASAFMSRARLDLHTGDHEAALEGASAAWRLWAELDMPYEAARTRILVAMARRAGGSEAAARRDLKAARATLERLGAQTELARVDALLGDAAPVATADRDVTTRVFLFTDIVTSTDLIGLIGDSAWQDLLDWHDRALREAIAASGGEEVRHTGDGFFVAFSDARQAIECAVAIQRRLASHRREHGFAPLVRIGMHRAEARRHGSDFAGKGVHEAARVGSVAGAEEVVVSSAVLDEAGPMPYPVSDAEMMDLKGIAEPVAVHRIDWR